MKRDEIKHIADQAIEELQEALAAGRSETLLRFLDVMSRFHNYSWNNCILIMIQMPQASCVAGFHRWLKLGRHVRKGEQGIGILAPLTYRSRREAEDNTLEPELAICGFKVVHVFDVSQTDGEDLPQLAGIHGDPGELLQRLEAFIHDSGITLKEEPLPLGTKGVSRKGEIAIAIGLPPAERFAVLAHEVAHELAHSEQRRRETAKTVRETEAEAVAYVVCRAFGLDCSTRSSDYIQLYQGDQTTLVESLDVIQKTATRIIESLQDAQPTAEDAQSQAA